MKSFCRSDDAWPEKEQDVNYKFYVCDSLPRLVQSLLVQFDEIPFDDVEQRRMAEPSKESLGELRRDDLFFHALAIFNSSATCGMAAQSSFLVLLVYSIAFFP